MSCFFVESLRHGDGRLTGATGSLREFSTEVEARDHALHRVMAVPLMRLGDFEEVRHATGEVLWRREVEGVVPTVDRKPWTISVAGGGVGVYKS